MAAWPSSRAAASIAASRRSFIRPQPDTGRRAGLVKNEGTVGLRLHARNQLAHQRRERHGVRTAVFRSAARDVPSCAVIAQFAARHAGNFVPPLARQQQYPKQRRERARSAGCQWRVDGFACPPKPADFVGAQYAIARLWPRGPVHTRTRIDAASVRILTMIGLPGCTQGARQNVLCPGR
jgi:hypothetical protein